MAFSEEVYEFFFGDDIQGRLLIRSTSVVLWFVVGYVGFVKWIGPALMRSRTPFDLRSTIIAYNFVQVVCNTIICCELLYYGKTLWNERCVIHKKPNYPLYVKSANKLIWYIYLVKISDCLDTVFFVLRKKDNQITFLHVFHHAAMVLLFHFGIKSLKIGFFLVIGIGINTFIHVVMYFYYFLAAFGPSMQKYLWWKRYLTQMQIIQFMTILAYMTWAFATGCEELDLLEVSCYIFVALLLALFLNFYFKAFKKK